jgi:protein SCO1
MSRLRNPYLWAFVIGCVSVTLIRPLLRREPPPPPVLRQVPRFELVGVDGAPFGSDALRGHVYVANFFSTRCPALALPVMQAMAKLQELYREGGLDSIRLVSISTDPAYDTPERLRATQASYGVDPARWALLTGELETVRSVAEQGFQVPLGALGGGSVCDAGHPSPLLLVDPQGALRGVYGSDEAGFDEVFWRSRHVLQEAQGR